MKPWTAFWLVVAIAIVCSCIVTLHEIEIDRCDQLVYEEISL